MSIGGVVVVCIGLLAWWLASSGADSPRRTDSASTTAATVQPASTSTGSPTSMGPTASSPAPTGVDPVSGLPWISRNALPREALHTLALIASGGPFPYDRDGITFENFEGLLPAEPSGYYHEYTVVTPGSWDRGARRIIAGASGELYYTDDHYESFDRIAP